MYFWNKLLTYFSLFLILIDGSIRYLHVYFIPLLCNRSDTSYLKFVQFWTNTAPVIYGCHFSFFSSLVPNLIDTLPVPSLRFGRNLPTCVVKFTPHFMIWFKSMFMLLLLCSVSFCIDSQLSSNQLVQICILIQFLRSYLQISSLWLLRRWN